ncbi:DHA2 family efflux MFS transporter permease subunit [Lactobacillus sp. ESL0731]|uniref:DHA2 family efflux MFS transporter permease subunit n=1 Tax=unclassified Lactobacillus TaxID=2620435 RepID=UPI0023FA2F67|nr:MULTISPECIES: DHA2 family efflux MFS transporter permease subunit [unclassified Lactobacillus]WEV51830.1 DHA2 family efflux MFS transporter permease subunit [Lactobacillus sp. ESL0700]WEV62960.1 DHA2 family efflux MFS transporter permease subunit [Lactobacillus sp. ESL0731]
MQRKLDAKLILSILAAGLMSFSGVLIETAGNITFPVLMQEFNVNMATVQWMTTGYLLIAAIIMPLSAYLKKNFSSKKLFVTAAILFIIGLLIDSLTTKSMGFIFLVIGRIVQGAGAGIALPLMFNIILERTPLDKVGLLMGIGTMITAVAPALGPTFGGLVVNTLSWRYIFILIIPVMIISFIMGVLCITKDPYPLSHTKLDWAGFIEIALTFVGLILAFSNLSGILVRPLEFVVPLVIGLIALAIFIKHSLKVKEPLLNIRLLKNSKFTAGIIAYFIFQVNTVGLSFILPNYLQIVNTTSAMVAGLLLLPGGAIGAVASPVSGRMLDNYGPRKPIMTGACFELVGSIMFCLFAQHFTGSNVLVSYLVIMMGTGLIMGDTMTSSLNLLTKEENADGNGLFNMVQQFSGAVGTSIVSAIMQFVQQMSSKPTPAGKLIDGAQVGLIFLLILVVIGVYLLHKATKKDSLSES